MSEGRKASSLFDVNFYKSNYGDLKSAFGNNTAEYINILPKMDIMKVERVLEITVLLKQQTAFSMLNTMQR